MARYEINGGNPLRYRGYIYDTETGFYYLQSRYYDPANHRFINADVSTPVRTSAALWQAICLRIAKTIL